MKNIIENRITKLRENFKGMKYDAVYISFPENVFYLSGFTGFNDAKLLITQKEAFIISDYRYIIQISEQCPNYKFILTKSSEEGLPDSFISELGINCPAVENLHISFSEYKKVAGKFGRRSLPGVNKLVDDLRIIKDEYEISLIEKACSIADNALLETLPFIKEGVKEIDIACELEYRMRKGGGSKPSFDTIIASGIRGSMPHGVASEKKIIAGESITIDFGTVYKGYCSDMTRNIFLGEPSNEMKNIYRIVSEAQQLALNSYEYGMEAAKLDAVARDYIYDNGFGDNFGHSLGHGVGVEIHELPTISPRSKNFLIEGMVFSCEPGIYISGIGGVRIEDLVSVYNGKLKILTQFTKAPVLL